MIIAGFKGGKNYVEFLKSLIPDLTNKVYVEPFGGYFETLEHMDTKPIKSVYNDLYTYDKEIIADEIHHLDYKEIIEKYDSDNTIFYLDPPYLGKEKYYDINQGEDNFEFYKELLGILKNIKGDWIMSHNTNHEIEKLFRDFNIYYYDEYSDYFNHKYEILISKNKLV